MRFKSLALFVIVAAILGLQISIQSQKSEAPNKQIFPRERQLPILDFSIANSADFAVRSKQQKARAARYDRQSSQPIQEGNMISGRIWSAHWVTGLTALPFAESDVVLIGGVLNASAHLSNDKTGIYSEFNVQVQEILKNNTTDSISSGAVVSLERFGGAVRFQSGVIQKYETTGQGMPTAGEHYLFFLKRLNAEEFSILTGYQLDGSVVRPLDGAIVEGGRGKYPFDIYQGLDVVNFLGIVKSAANGPSNDKPGN